MHAILLQLFYKNKIFIIQNYFLFFHFHDFMPLSCTFYILSTRNISNIFFSILLFQYTHRFMLLFNRLNDYVCILAAGPKMILLAQKLRDHLDENLV